MKASDLIKWLVDTMKTGDDLEVTFADTARPTNNEYEVEGTTTPIIRAGELTTDPSEIVVFIHRLDPGVRGERRLRRDAEELALTPDNGPEFRSRAGAGSAPPREAAAQPVSQEPRAVAEAARSRVADEGVRRSKQ